MQSLISAERWDAMRDEHIGAPPTLIRIAVTAGLHPGTVREASTRLGWPRLNLNKAERRWQNGHRVESLFHSLEGFVGVHAPNEREVFEAVQRWLESRNRKIRPELFEAAMNGLVAAGVIAPARVGEAVIETTPGEAAQPTGPMESPGEDDTTGMRSARLVRLMHDQCDALLARAKAQGGTLTKAQLDTANAWLRLADRLETLAQERAVQEQTRSDDEIAAVLERIDDRIVELAQEHAERLVAQKSDG
ncbi:MAG: hypothetical protein AB7P20_06340 [Rhizobiaceae bacterium]